MKSTKSGFIIPLLLIIAAVLIIGGGVYIYSQHQKMLTEEAQLNANASTTDNISSVPTLNNYEDSTTTTNTNSSATIATKVQTQTIAESNVSTQTSGWKIYDSGRGFSFKYPPNFIFDNGNSTATNIIFTYKDQGQRYFVVTVEGSSTSFELQQDVQAIVEASKADSASAATPLTVAYKPYVIGNVSGYLITSEAGDVLRNTSAVFVTLKDNTLFNFEYGYAGTTAAQNNFYNQIQTIISTLQ